MPGVSRTQAAMKVWLAAALCISAVSGTPLQALDYVSLDPPVEVRALWIDAAAIPRYENGVRELVETCAAAGFNVLFPEVICRGYAVYPSELLARDPRFAGAPDTLAVMIREAHRLGVEVHPWVWVFRAGYSYDHGAILKAHPDWAERDSEGNELSTNGGYWLSPANPDVRDFLIDVFCELVARYEVDGLHLDYIRYESQDAGDYGYSECSVAEFIRQFGYDPRPRTAIIVKDSQNPQAAQDPSVGIDEARKFFELPVGPVREGELRLRDNWRRFRELQVSSFVERAARRIRAAARKALGPLRRPLVISAAVGEMPDLARLNLMQNWLNWLDNKWLDFVVPMSYSTDDQRFSRLVRRQRATVGGRSLLVPGIGVFMHEDPRQAVCQIALAREAGADGTSLFSASYLTDESVTALATGPYAPAGSDTPTARAGRTNSTLLAFRDPWGAVARLRRRACELYAGGRSDEADYFSGRADALAQYASWRDCPTPHFPPVYTMLPAPQPEPVISQPPAETPAAAEDTGPSNREAQP
ncbi:MAG: glycoside hydrolase family 10 protein [Armatimonadota bacterium]